MRITPLLNIYVLIACVFSWRIIYGNSDGDAPTELPVENPTEYPSVNPTLFPTIVPTKLPTPIPSCVPTYVSTSSPSVSPTILPTAVPTKVPTTVPTACPTILPTISPTIFPTVNPSVTPTKFPTALPSVLPSEIPSVCPSLLPTISPSEIPSVIPSTVQPTVRPSHRPTSRPSSRPSLNPSSRPSSQPTAQPTGQPTGQPSRQPTGQPTGQPSKQPSRQPTGQPSKQPISRPTSRPSMQPTSQPSLQPFSKPSAQPSRQPSIQPSRQPLSQPSGQPSSQPSRQPLSRPSSQPSSQPSRQPLTQPSSQPSSQPSRQPFCQPSRQPNSRPSSQPSERPTSQPSRQPSGQPSRQPTSQPSSSPTCQPTRRPSSQPTGAPVSHPSAQPSHQPTEQPTSQPSRKPSSQPQSVPSTRPSAQPSQSPSSQPSGQPTALPSAQPVAPPSSLPASRPSSQPSMQPTVKPSDQPTSWPSGQPTSQPSRKPSAQPTDEPSRQPTVHPSSQPSRQPMSRPTSHPTNQPTHRPTAQPTGQPSSQPASHPSTSPSMRPFNKPTSQPSSQPTTLPSAQPVSRPSGQPSSQPASRPSTQPTVQPTSQPSAQPVSHPSTHPTSQPSSLPSNHPASLPTGQPSGRPSVQPSTQPSRQPSSQPSSQPNSRPSSQPTERPTSQPSRQPSGQPSRQPTSQPSSSPTCQPTRRPSSQPTGAPVSHPSAQPSHQPTEQPTSQPSRRPSAQPSRVPSSQPSSSPTTEDSVRLFECGSSGLSCESGSFSHCSFFTGNILFMCVDEATPCLINAGNFSVGPNTNLTVNGTCELVVVAAHSIIIHPNTTIKAPAVNFTASADILVAGGVLSSGLGPLNGAGAPVSAGGEGGSYGGGGGRFLCNGTYFFGPDEQVGSVDVLPDLRPPYSFTSPTLGSGGGEVGAGRGGGRIILRAKAKVDLVSSSVLASEGSTSQMAGLGAGSGGSISVIAGTYSGAGLLSVKGGDCDSGAGCGGGGRISITISKAINMTAAENTERYLLSGGALRNSHHRCSSGGAGTLYFRNGVNTAHSATIRTYNGNVSTFAATLLDRMPVHVAALEASSNAVVAGNNNLTLPLLPHCSRYSWSGRNRSSKSNPRQALCSTITLSNATVVSLANTTNVIASLNGQPFVVINDTQYSGPVNATMFLMQADVLLMRRSAVLGLDYLSSFAISAGVVDLSSGSSIQFSNQLVIDVFDSARLLGRIEQTPLPNFSGVGSRQYYFYSTVAIVAVNNVTLRSVVATNARIRVGRLTVEDWGVVAPPSDLVSACLADLSSSELTCGSSAFTSDMAYNNTFAIVANSSIDVMSNAVVTASALLLCAPSIHIDAGASINADSRGCGGGRGAGQGGSTDSDSVGGGGGGFGGAGGAGLGSTSNGGITYFVEKKVFSGSGGSCFNGSCPVTSPPSSRGGGIVSVVARQKLVLHGNITSNGMPGLANDGGGSGGSVSLNAGSLYGVGRLQAFGGSGGSGPFPGGGGGGGYIQIYNPQSSYSSFTSFSGQIEAFGGTGGMVTLFSAHAEYFGQLDRSSRRNLRSSRSLSFSSADPGQTGEVLLPSCPEGSGNVQSTGQICQLCPVGSFKADNSSDPCVSCTNAPSHSTYTTNGWKSANCPYQCDSGRATVNCYTPIQNFIFNVLTLGGLGGCIAAFFLIVIAPLLFYRLKDKYGWFENKQMDVLGDLFKKANILDLGFGDDSVLPSKRSVSTSLDKVSLRNPVLARRDKTGIQDIQSKVAQAHTLKDLRRVLRLADQDLPFHACRVNLLGSNHPWTSRGGPWILPPSRPVCLRPMLLRREYRAFAEDVNRSLAWSPWALDMCFLYAMTCLAPPLSAVIMNYIRKRRTAILLHKVATYDHSCFRCIKQRLARNSLRVGISPDSTIAFLDFLFDEEHFRPRVRPLCPIGQTKLPVSFKLAGLGTYFSPYFVDTNDMILQAVPQTDVASSFIDEAWISFICELNTILRSVQSDAIHLGILSLIRFLNDEKHTARLGGLVVEFCTFANLPESFPSDVVAEEEEEVALRQLTGDPAIQSPAPEELKSSPKGGRKTPAQKSVELDRDSFVAATRAQHRPFERRSETGNWFSQLGDALHLTRTGADPHLSRSGPHGRMESTDGVELKETTRHSDSPVRVSESITRSSGATISANTKANAQTTSKSDAANSWPMWDYVMSVIYYRLFHLTQCAWRVVQLFTESSMRPEDPHGYDLSFDEMCNAVQEGKLKLGILVTHAKVSSNSYILQDEDYQSEDDDEANYDSFNERASNMSGGQRRSGAGSDDDEDASVRGSLADFSRSSLASRESSHSLERAYGPRAEEMTRFYKIMLAAEVSMTATTSAASQTSAQKPLFPPLPSRSSSNSLVEKAARTSDSAKKENAKKSGHRAGLSTEKHLSSKIKIAEAPQQYTDFRSVSKSTGESKLSEYVEFGSSRVSDGLEEFRGSSGDERGSADLDEEQGVERGSERGGERGSERGSEAVRDSSADSAANVTRASFRSVVQPSTPQERQSSASAASEAQSSRRGSASALSPPKSLLRGPRGGASPAEPKLTSIAKMPPSRIAVETTAASTVLMSKAKRTGGRRNLNKLQNLAPSACQHPVNKWRWKSDGGEPVSHHHENNQRIENAIVTKQNPISILKASGTKNIHSNSGAGLGSARSATKALVVTAKYPKRQSASKELSADAESRKFSAKVNHRTSFVFEIEESDFAERDSNYGWRDPDMHYTANMMRNTMYNNSRNSVGGLQDDGGRRGSAANRKSVTRKSKLSSKKRNSKQIELTPRGGGKVNSGAAASAPVDVEALVPEEQHVGWKLTQQPAKQLQKGFRYAYMNKLFLFYLSRFMFGSNIYPYGPNYVRKILELLFFALSLADLALIGFILIDTYCVSSNTTSCSDHQAWILILSVWPGAVILAPITGLVAMFLGPSGALARIYALWSRLAGINNVVILVFFLQYYSYFLDSYGSVYPVLLLTSSRAFQCLFVDLYIAHVEKLRYTRGWDGLHTSLFKTKDNKQELAL